MTDTAAKTYLAEKQCVTLNGYGKDLNTTLSWYLRNGGTLYYNHPMVYQIAFDDCVKSLKLSKTTVPDNYKQLDYCMNTTGFANL